MMTNREEPSTMGWVRPKAMAPGRRVALVAPAGPCTRERIDESVARCRGLGFEPVLGRSAAERRGYLAGTDEQRLADMEWAIRDPGIDAIWALRGGYGTGRLLDRLDLSPLRDGPKPFIGFSDNTALHLAFGKAGLVSFLGPHAGGPFPEFSRRRLLEALTATRPTGPLPVPAGAEPQALHPGTARGRLAGGNLALLAAACGTPFALDGRGRILLIEDVNEPAYRIDRSWTQLRLAGCLDGLAGVGFGRFSWTEVRPASEPDIPAVLAELVAPLGVPAIYGLPFGHVDDQWCLPLGVDARLDAGRGVLELLEPGVTAIGTGE